MAELNIYFASINEDCYLPRLLALWELASSQPLRNLGKHNGVSELGSSREHEIISFLRIWPTVKSPSRPHLLFPPLFFTFNPKDHRRAAAVVEWKVRLDLWGRSFTRCSLLSFSERSCSSDCGIWVELLWTAVFLFLRQNYPSLRLLGLKNFKNYIPYFSLFSELICVLWKSWFKNKMALIYFKGISLKYNT